MQGLADNPAIQLLSLIVGGFPARYLAAYCEGGNLDANMRKASGDLATYYVVAAAILALAALACPPLAIMSGLCGIAAGIFKALATGQPPSLNDVSGFLKAAGPAIQAFSGGNGLDMSKVGDAAGAFSSAADTPALAAAAGVAGGLPQLGAAPPSCSPASAAERAASRALALTKAKAKAKYKTAHIAALACAKARAQVATARQRGQTVKLPISVDVAPYHFNFTADSKCLADFSTPVSTAAAATTPAPAASSSSSKLAIVAAVALGAAKVFGVLG